MLTTPPRLEPMGPSTLGEDWVDDPAIGADGTVYFGSADGHLYAVGP
jgi:outer membrane protein assembly factor BamB